MILISIYYLLALSYVLLLLLLCYYWKQLKNNNVLQGSHHQKKEQQQQQQKQLTCLPLTVIVVVRNEEKNIEALLGDLDRQSYPKSNFEVLVVNDHSTDGTVEKVIKVAREGALPLQLLQLQGAQGKKAGVEMGVKQARGSVVVVTDGDCRVGEDWLKTMALVFDIEQAVFVAGPVSYTPTKNLFEKLQLIEFASLVGTGAAMLQAGLPGMCNAANMAFSREAYLAVKGYSTNSHIPSGDDEFLLQALSMEYPGKVFYLKSREVLVETRAQPSWNEFYQQRKRWAGKWHLHRKPSVAISAIGVFLFHAAWLGLSLVLVVQQPFIYFFMGALVKLGAEFLFLHLVLKSFGKKLPLFPFMVLQVLYPFYALFFGIAVNFGSFTWKDRTYKYAKT